MDTRDIYRRLEELRDERTALVDAIEEARDQEREAEEASPPEIHEENAEAVTAAQEALADWDRDNAEELKEHEEIEEIGISGFIRGVELIEEREFEKHAQDMADSIHPREMFNAWPFTCIDWEAAADELCADYSTLEFQGTTYYYQD